MHLSTAECGLSRSVFAYLIRDDGLTRYSGVERGRGSRWDHG